MTLRCYACKEAIDDDACFCDQCGKEIFQCGACGHLGKGPRCPQDGTAMQSRKPAAGSPTTPLAPAPATSPPTPPPPSKPQPAPAVSGAVTSGNTLHLRGAAQGLDLVINPGDLLGRRFGPHAGTLQRFSQISSNHLELRRGADGRWFAKDLNSFNHSFYNGAQLTPQVEIAIEAGGVLSLGNVALDVSLE
jgi:hypothetical protein